MKNELRFNTISTAEIPAKRTRKYNAVKAGVRAFYDSDADAAEVDYKGSYKTPASAANALSVAAKSEGLKPFLRVIQRGERVFIVRVYARIKI